MPLKKLVWRVAVTEGGGGGGVIVEEGVGNISRKGVRVQESGGEKIEGGCDPQRNYKALVFWYISGSREKDHCHETC